MSSEALSSRDKLDQMLRDKKITPDEHRRLIEAMVGRDRLEPVRLCKSFKEAQIGGLCAGCAKYFGLDVLVVRGILILATCLLLGVFTIPLYVLGCLFVPWDEPEKARALRQTGHPRLFTLALALFLLIVPALFSVTALPALQETYAQFGKPIFSAEGQQTLAGRAFDCASEYRSLLREIAYGPFEHKALASMLILPFILLVLLLGAAYTILCSERRRKQYARATIWLAIAWSLFLIAGSLYPLLHMAQKI